MSDIRGQVDTQIGVKVFMEIVSVVVARIAADEAAKLKHWPHERLWRLLYSQLRGMAVAELRAEFNEGQK